MVIISPQMATRNSEPNERRASRTGMVWPEGTPFALGSVEKLYWLFTGRAEGQAPLLRADFVPWEDCMNPSNSPAKRAIRSRNSPMSRRIAHCPGSMTAARAMAAPMIAISS